MRRLAFALLLATSVLHAQGKPSAAELQPSTAHYVSGSATPDQVREYLKLTHFGEIWRAGWLDAMDRNRSKGAPYWPDSFWNDLRKQMETVDLVPMVTDLYRNHVSRDDMQRANTDLKKMSTGEFAATSFGAHFCQETQLAGPENESATLKLTQALFEQVYSAHKAEIKIARAKYAAEHPGFIGPPPR